MALFPGLPRWVGTRKVEPIWILVKQDSEWQWHQLDHIQVCNSLQTDNHASTPPLSFLQAGCPSFHPTNSVKALKAYNIKINKACQNYYWLFIDAAHIVWARGQCRISPPRFLAECCKRQLNQVSLVLLYLRLSAFSDLCWVCLSVFSCTVLFVSISQVIGCEDCLRNDLYSVGWGVKLYSNQTKPEQGLCNSRAFVRLTHRQTAAAADASNTKFRAYSTQTCCLTLPYISSRKESTVDKHTAVETPW